MYARVASFEGRDSSLTDQLIQRVQDQGPSSVPDAKGFLGLFDRERGTSLGITFFDSEEAIRNSEQAFEDMARDFPSEMRGRQDRGRRLRSHDLRGRRRAREGGPRQLLRRIAGRHRRGHQQDEVRDAAAGSQDERKRRCRRSRGPRAAVVARSSRSGRARTPCQERAGRGSASRAGCQRAGQSIAGVDRYEGRWRSS